MIVFLKLKKELKYFAVFCFAPGESKKESPTKHSGMYLIILIEYSVVFCRGSRKIKTTITNQTFRYVFNNFV